MSLSSVRQAAAVAAVLGVATFGATAQAAEMATVISSTPVTAAVPVNQQVCSDGQQIVQTPPSGAGAILGAIAGGVIGHQLGGGFGKAAATGLGAVAGSVVGNQVEANATPATAVPVQRCQNTRGVENRVVGYDVIYEYAGQRYSTRMTRDPGRQFAVSVQPADAAGTLLPAPVYSDAQPVPQAVPPAAPQTVYQTAPQTVYYQPAPQTVYYGPGYYAPNYYVPPVSIGLGFGYYGHGRWR